MPGAPSSVLVASDLTSKATQKNVLPMVLPLFQLPSLPPNLTSVPTNNLQHVRTLDVQKYILNRLYTFTFS